MATKYYKYPRTKHFPWSEHVTTDDKKFTQEEVDRIFVGSEVVVSEKLDGECATIYFDGYAHARSPSSKDHASRHWIKALAASISHDIPEGWRITGENLWAQHSIHYRNLSTYFYVFGIWNEKNYCLPWSETLDWCEMLGLETVPVLLQPCLWNEDKVKACYTGKSVFEGSYDVEQYEKHGKIVLAQEGYVVRKTVGFDFPEAEDSERACLLEVGKMVRRGHVTTDDHWLQSAIIPNELRKS